MMENSLKSQLKSGKRAIGCWLQYPSAHAAEILAQSGLDFLLIDHEHGNGDVRSAVEEMRALKGTGMAAMVRVPWNDATYFKRILDAGALNVLCPSVEDEAEAEAVARACLYPPRGRRGAGGGIRAASYGADQTYFDAVEEQLLIAVQIETARAVDRIEKIAAVPGIDMLFIGPRDLSASLGKLNRFDDPELKALMATAEKRILGCGKYLGSVIYPGLTAVEMYQRGYHLLVGGSDTSFLLEGARKLRASAS